MMDGLPFKNVAAPVSPWPGVFSTLPGCSEGIPTWLAVPETQALPSL